MVRITPRAFALRQMPGFSVLVCTTGFTLPGWLWIATAHRDHWNHFASGPYWTTFAMPMGGRIWSVLATFALIGWVVSGQREHPLVGPALYQNLVRALVGFVGIALCAAPSWVWCAELGILEASQVPNLIVSALLVPLVGGISAACGTVLIRRVMGAVLGLGAAGCIFLFVWGGLT